MTDALPTSTDPLGMPCPLDTWKLPPVPSLDSPAPRTTFPATPEVLVPAPMWISPPWTDDEDPVLMSIVPDVRVSDAPVFTESAPDALVPSMLADSILIDPLVALGETAPPLVTVTDAV